MTQPLAGYGLTVQLPAAWEGRIYQRPAPTNAFTPANRAVAPATTRTSGSKPGNTGWLGERTRPVMHLANFALPADRGDYGSGAVEIMGSPGVFISLLEFGPECLGTALYSPQGLPRTNPRSFDPNGLQRRIIGQSGFQHFFTDHNRPMCLYVVLGAHIDATALSAQVNQVLDQIQVTPA